MSADPGVIAHLGSTLGCESLVSQFLLVERSVCAYELGYLTSCGLSEEGKILLSFLSGSSLMIYDNMRTQEYN